MLGWVGRHDQFPGLGYQLVTIVGIWSRGIVPLDLWFIGLWCSHRETGELLAQGVVMAISLGGSARRRGKIRKG